MNVVSLFDGISCARVALDRAGIAVKSYTACEIEKNAIKVSSKNYPDITQAGGVKEYTPPPNIDLLVGGSPCQDLSIAKKGRKGLDGERSGLFWEYVRIKKEANPKWFILENVASMPKADRDIITREMGVEPILINASLVSAQCRKRLFWTNIPDVVLPEDRGILLKDILQPDAEVDERMVVKGKAFCLTATYSHANSTEAGVKNSIERKQRTQVKLGHLGNSDAQGNRIYSTDGKSVCLCGRGGGGFYQVKRVGRDIGRRLNEEGVREDYNKDIPTQRRSEVRTDDKCGTLTSVQKDNLVVGSHIRKLTPIECERLQGLPDNYTEGIAMTNRYKCLGNAFNVDVVAHILSFLPSQ